MSPAMPPLGLDPLSHPMAKRPGEVEEVRFIVTMRQYSCTGMGIMFLLQIKLSIDVNKRRHTLLIQYII